MGTRPIDRIVQWLAHRRDMQQRPPVALECADCGKTVGPDEGFWFPQWRIAACGDDCAFILQGDRF